MSNKSITILTDFLGGVYNAPPSKSHMFRALFLSLISKKARIYNPLYNNDTNVLIDIFIKMGAIIDKNSDYLDIYFPNITILKEYDFKNSGTALRFMTTYLSTVLHGTEKAFPNTSTSLSDRPLLKEGAKSHSKLENLKPPLGGLGASLVEEAPNPLLKEGAKTHSKLENLKPPLGGLGASEINERMVKGLGASLVEKRGFGYPDKIILIRGDEQLEKRKILPLLSSLEKLGLKYSKLSENDLPFIIKSEIKSGKTSISGKSSQFLSSLLLNLPFLDGNSTIIVEELHELPYIDITLWWLDKFNINYKNYNYKKFDILGNQKLLPFEITIPGDYSSSAFIILATTLNGDVEIRGLDRTDPQGDKFVLKFLEKIGLKINYTQNGFRIVGEVNRGGEFDLNDTPDLLPALVLFSVNYSYEFKFYNVESARFKETDRISSVVKILESLGIKVDEFKDGLSFKGGLKRALNSVSGFNDHRIIMASSLLGIKKGYKVIINDIKNIKGSYPTYFQDLESLT